MFVVSANYRDRESAYKWLVRQEDEPMAAAKAYKSLMATGVEFIDSNQAEKGFGCRVVARCETVTVDVGDLNQPMNSRRFPLRFAGNSFFKKGTREEVKSLDALELREDGSMVGRLDDIQEIVVAD